MRVIVLLHMLLAAIDPGSNDSLQSAAYQRRSPARLPTEGPSLRLRGLRATEAEVVQKPSALEAARFVQRKPAIRHP